MTLMAHCGSDPITRTELAALPVPQPQGPRHHPMAFSSFIDLVQNELSDVGLSVNDEAFTVTPDHNRFFGLMSLTGTDDIAGDYALMLGLRGSHDQSIGRGLAIGSRVFVCDNLSFSGDFVLNTKQTTHIEKRLPPMIQDTVKKLPMHVEQQQRLFDKFKQSNLTDYRADALITRVIRAGIVPASKSVKLIETWDTPNHDYGGRTAWGLYNTVTEVLRPTWQRGAVYRSTNRSLALTRLFAEEIV